MSCIYCRVRCLVVAFALSLLFCSSTFGQGQISPNPNPFGNTITLNNGGALWFNSESFENNGSIENFDTLTNVDPLFNNETLTNFGCLTNIEFGLLTNFGCLTNDGTLFNESDGTLFNESFGMLFNDTLTNFGCLRNNGTLNNCGTLTNESCGTLTNFGCLDNFGTLTNESFGTLFNDTLTNFGFLTNDGTLFNNFTLTNNGTINGSGMFFGTLDDAGTIAPGNSAGVLTFEDWDKTSGSVEIELGGFFDGGGDKTLTEFDWIDVTGNLFLAGSLDVQFINGFEITGGMSFEIVNVVGSLTGTFTGLGEGALVGSFGGTDLIISYAGGDGNDVVLSAQATNPPNDDFANTIGLGALPFNTTGTNVNATTETGEQELDITGATVWWFFQAPGDGTVTVDTFGSDFDTVLHIYEGFFPGATVADLMPVANNDQAGGTNQSEVAFPVESGDCYEVRVGGYLPAGPAEGNIVLNGTFVPDAVVLLGDVNLDGIVNLLDVDPFIAVLSGAPFQAEADCDENGVVNLLDVDPFIAILSGGS